MQNLGCGANALIDHAPNYYSCNFQPSYPITYIKLIDFISNIQQNEARYPFYVLCIISRSGEFQIPNEKIMPVVFNLVLS